MGNCLTIEAKVIKFKNKDGEMLEHDAPQEVQHLLADFPVHASSESYAASSALLPDQVSHLPSSSTAQETEERNTPTTSNGDDHAAGAGESKCSSGGIIRIKLLVTKQQLEDILTKGVSLDNMITNLTRGAYNIDSPNSRWKPTLRSIPEGCDEKQELL
ncbi:uncharacterized protein LOC116246055 [Nymphaea colorata]|uniref:Uncharacterized protein n=1 Tax=Nymphaea colorata TaxID=210225 RepID=A0A5K0VA58_9MAGN|nr:uncharacterized protein LOC116246055 [Nymphaea colorata]